MSKQRKPEKKTGITAPDKIKTTPHPTPSLLSQKWPELLLAATMLFVLVARFSLLDVPLERDEGSFAYIAKMTMEGRQLYTDVCDSKLPGLYLLYSIFISIFGYSAEGIHLGLLVFNLGAIFMLFVLIKTLFDAQSAALACVIFALFTLSQNMAGFAAHATQLLLWPLLAGFWLLADTLYTERKAWKFLTAGLLLGFAFIIKQQVFSLMPFAAFFLLVHDYYTQKPFNYLRSLKDILLLAIGSATPFLIVIAWMYATGRFQDFWFWTFQAPVSLSETTFSNKDTLISGTLPDIVKGQQLIWILGLLGAIIGILAPMRPEKKFFVLAFPVFVAIGIASGIAFSNHYFIMAAPPLALLCGLAVRQAHRVFSGNSASETEAKEPPFSAANYLMLLIFVAAVFQTLFKQGSYYFKDSNVAILRECYGGNPFAESYEMGKELKKRAKEGDQLLILGSEPEMLVASELPSATGLLFMYDLFNGAAHNQALQTRYLEAFASKPRFVALVNVPTSWSMPKNDLNNQFLASMDKFIKDPNLYQKIGTADLLPNKSVYKWDDAARGNTDRAQFYVDIFELKQ